MWTDSLGNPMELPPNYEPGDSKAFLDWMCRIAGCPLGDLDSDMKKKSPKAQIT